MATPPSLVQIAFAGGLDQSQEAEVLDPSAAFLLLQNGRQEKRGGYSKRLGYTSLPTLRMDATSRTLGNRLISHRDIACAIDGTNLDAYVEGLSASAVASRVPEVSVSTRALTGVATTLYGAVLCGDYVACATLRGTDVIVGLETSAGVVLRAPERVYDAAVAETAACLVTYSTYIILLAVESSVANVAAYYLNTATRNTINAGWVFIGNMATDKPVVGTASIALSAQSLTDRVAFAYVNNSVGTSRVTVKTMDFGGITETAVVDTASITPDSVCVEGNLADTLWVAWNQTTTVRLRGLTPNSLATVKATTATMLTLNTANGQWAPFVVSSTAGAGRIAVNDGDTNNLQIRTFTTAAGAAVAGGTQTTIRGAILDALPFYRGDRFYGLFRSGEATNGVTVLCDFTETTTSTTAWMRPIGIAFPGLVQASPLKASRPLVTTNTVAYAVPVKRSAVSMGCELVTYDFADAKRWRSTTHNGSLYLSAGILAYFDGRRVAEAAFLHAPKAPVATDSGAGSGPNGSYRYVATFEEVDDDGNWCISGVSLPSNLLTVVTRTINLTTNPVSITSRLRPATLSLDYRVKVTYYRTKAGGEAPYFYVGEADNITLQAATMSDSTSDTTLASNRLLYGTGNLPGTNGAGLNHDAPPYCADVVSFAGMLVVASGSDVWWSFQTVSGEGVSFSAEQFYVTVPGPGNITALAALDGTLYAFKAQEVYAIAGEAPSDNGTSGGLSEPRRLAVDVGCSDPRSVVVTSAGVFFLSARGIELLGRGGSVVWVGEQVQDTLASYPVVSSAVLDDKAALVRFSLAASTTSSTGRVSGDGADIVFDLSLTKWMSVDVKTGATSTQASQDACMMTLTGVRRYAWLGATGIVYPERLATESLAYLDGNTWVTLGADTAWFKASGIQGRQTLSKALFLARKVGDFDVAMSLAYNYETTYRTARTWLRADTNALLSAGWPITQLQHEPHDDAECQSVRIRLRDATPTGGTVGNGRGATWLALTLDLTPNVGAFDVPEQAR